MAFYALSSLFFQKAALIIRFKNALINQKATKSIPKIEIQHLLNMFIYLY